VTPVIITCPRRVDYFTETYSAVCAELPSVVVLTDTPLDFPDNKHIGWGALEIAGGDDLLFLEDDVLPLIPGAFRQMTEHRTPEGLAFTSFYHPAKLPGVYRAGEFQMSQAVLFPAETVERLLAFRGSAEWLAVRGFDLAVAACLKHTSYEQRPNLVNHVGEWSAAMPGHRSPSAMNH